METTPARPRIAVAGPSRGRALGATLTLLLLAAGGIAATAVAGSPSSAAPRVTAASPVGTPDDVAWRRMVFRASKLLVTATAEVELAWADAPATLAQLEKAAGIDPLVPSSQSVARMSVSTSLLGRESKTQIWLDPVDLSALQRRQLEEGKRERLKLYRFGRSGIYARRVRPAQGESGQAFERWTDVQEEVVPREAEGPISDASALFYWLSSVEPQSLSEGRTVLIFSKSLVNPVVVRYAGAEELRVDYLLHGAPDAEGNAIPVSGRIPAYRYSLTPGAGDEDELELLGLEGDLELWVDAVRRVPVRLSGRVSPVGKVSANLHEVWLKARPAG